MKRRARLVQPRQGKQLIAYIRVSQVGKRRGSEKYVSPEVQLADMERWAASNGYTIAKVITDEDRTGTESSQRQVADAISRVERGEADGILVRKIDRWGRNTMESLLNIAELQSVGGYIVSTSEDLNNIHTPAGNFSLQVLLAIAEMFSREMAKTWKSIHEYRREQGTTAHGGRRLGYIWKGQLPKEDWGKYEWPEGCEYVIDPKTAPWIERVVTRYLSGVALKTLVTELNAAGIRTRNDRPFTYLSLKYTLVAGFYAGLLHTERNGEVEYLPGNHEAIVSREVFEAFLTKLHDKSAPRNKHAPRRLTRLVTCSGCNLRMQTLTRTDRPGAQVVWVCGRSPKRFGSEYCPAPARIEEHLLEEQVRDWLMAHSDGQAAIDAQAARARAAIQAEKDLTKVEREIERQRRRLSLLADKVLDGEMPGAAAKIKEEEITQEIRRLEEMRSSATTEVVVNSLPDAKVFGALRHGWDVMPVAVYNEGLQKVIGRITVTKAGVRGARAKVAITGRWERPHSAVA